jgi:stage II sporulation protein P
VGRYIRARLKTLAVLALFAAGIYLWAGSRKPLENYLNENGPLLDPGGGTLSDPGVPSKPASQNPDLLGLGDIKFQPETTPVNPNETLREENLTAGDTEKLYDFAYLKAHFYSVESKYTELLPADINIGKFLLSDLRINTSVSGPKVLIFHTHSNEMFADSDISDPMDGIMGAGRLLADILRNQYGVETLHHTGRYDIVDGHSQILGAYERMEPAVEKILRENPSIQLAIDLHRDGLNPGAAPMTAEINGKRAAKIMFVNGISRVRQNGGLIPAPGLANPNLADNLALSFRMQLAAGEMFPGFTRKLYIKAYRYSTHMLPKSLLVEVGAQNNTKEEALNAMPPLAEVLAKVALP